MKQPIPVKHLGKLLIAYDDYIQEANKENKYATGWFPVCVNEFYDNEFQDILETERCQE